MNFQEVIDHLNKEVVNPPLVSAITIETKCGISDAKAKLSVVVHTPYSIAYGNGKAQRGIGPETLALIDVVIFSALEEEGELSYVDDIVIRSIPYVESGATVS